MSLSKLQNIQLDQKLKETEKVKSEAEEQVTTSKSCIEVLLEDLNVTKTETAQVIESKSQEIDTLLEKLGEADGVLVEMQSNISLSDALVEELKDNLAKVENNLLEEKNNLEGAEQVMESLEMSKKIAEQLATSSG